MGSSSSQVASPVCSGNDETPGHRLTVVELAERTKAREALGEKQR